MQKFITITASIVVGGLILSAIVGTFLVSYQAKVKSDINSTNIQKIAEYLQSKTAILEPNAKAK